MPTSEAEAQFYANHPATAKDGTAANTPNYDEMLFGELQVLGTGVAAAIFDITKDSVNASVPNRLRGGFYLELDARDADMYVRFRPDNGTPGTTAGVASNGEWIRNGTKVQRWISGSAYKYIDVIASAASTHLAIRRMSERRGDQNAPGKPGT